MQRFAAYIDPENQFCKEDKLSQINTLQQIENIGSYTFMRERMSSGLVHLHGIWFDIYTGDIYYFSRKQKKFVEVNETNIGKLLDEISKYLS